MIEILANEHELVFGLTLPLIIIQGKALAAEVEDMPLGAFVKPENAFGPENILRQLIVEEVLELTDGKGAIALKRNRGKPIDR